VDSLTSNIGHLLWSGPLDEDEAPRVTAGVAVPLTILAAGVAVVLLAFTVAEFTKAEPSAFSES
jgi:hypothetical protein